MRDLYNTSEPISRSLATVSVAIGTAPLSFHGEITSIPVFGAAKTPPVPAWFIHLLTPIQQIFSSQLTELLSTSGLIDERTSLSWRSHTGLWGAHLIGMLILPLGLFNMQTYCVISIPQCALNLYLIENYQTPCLLRTCLQLCTKEQKFLRNIWHQALNPQVM